MVVSITHGIPAARAASRPGSESSITTQALVAIARLWLKAAWALSLAYGDATWHRERVAAEVL